MSAKNMTKKDFVTELTNVVGNITDATLKSSVEYALKKLKDDSKSVTIGELRSLFKDAKKFIPENPDQLTLEPKDDPAPATPPTPEKSETSLKKKVKKSKDKTPEPKKQEEKPAEKKGEKTEKPTEKKGDKPIKKSKKEKQSKPSIQMIEMVAQFPETVQIGDVTLQRTEVTTSEELDSLLSGDTYVYAAFVWTKRQLRQFSYGDPRLGIIPPKKFENNLDIVEIAYHADQNDYHIFGGYSVETGCPYAFNGETLKPDDEGIRYSLGIEYAIYTVESTEK